MSQDAEAGGATAGAAEPVTRLTVTENGPILVDGDVQLLDSERRLLARETRTALCRCGASGNKPYCDGSHRAIGFEAPAEIGEGRVKAVDREVAAELTVRLRPDGPLLLDGPFRIAAEDSTDSLEGGGCALCRCGASARKPFCDGAHREIGFEAEDPVVA